MSRIYGWGVRIVLNINVFARYLLRNFSSMTCLTCSLPSYSFPLLSLKHFRFYCSFLIFVLSSPFFISISLPSFSFLCLRILPPSLPILSPYLPIYVVVVVAIDTGYLCDFLVSLLPDSSHSMYWGWGDHGRLNSIAVQCLWTAMLGDEVRVWRNWCVGQPRHPPPRCTPITGVK